MRYRMWEKEQQGLKDYGGERVKDQKPNMYKGKKDDEVNMNTF